MTARRVLVALLLVSCRRGPVSEPSAPSSELACRDFYQYANRDWLATATIPPDEERWSARLEMKQRALGVLHDILESLRTTPAPAGTLEAVLGQFYGTCMDAARADADGAAPLRDQLARIDAIDTKASLAREVSRLHLEGTAAVFAFAGAQDRRNATEVIAEASPTDILGLPDRDYYLRAGADTETVRTAYVAHIARTLALTGVAEPGSQAQAKRVMAFETALARGSLTVTEQQDPTAVQHPMTRAELDALMPAWSWQLYLEVVGRPDIATINLTQPSYFAAIDALVRTAPLDDWKAYLRWRVAAQAAPYLSSAFVDEDFRYAAQLGGVQQLAPRWRRCVAVTDELLGEAIGRLYVAKEFPPAAKASATALAGNVRATLREQLATLDWMTAATRQRAIAKLDAMVIQMGYPDAWRDHAALATAPGPFWSNVVAARRFEAARQLAKIGRPVDRNEWLQTPAAVDGYYDDRLNRASVAAGLLQPPYFDPGGDLAANYGALGVMVGHELTHGFDARGRRFDARGSLRDWWAPEDEREYLRRAQLLIDQFNGYVVIDGMHIDGQQTLSENLADLGGLEIAYAALQRALRDQPRTLIGGLTPEQRFFVAYARSWRSAYRVKFPSFCPLAVWPLLVTWGTEPRAPGWVDGGGGAAAGVCARAAKGGRSASESTHFASKEPAGRRQPLFVVIETFFILEHAP